MIRKRNGLGVLIVTDPWLADKLMNGEIPTDRAPKIRARKNTEAIKIEAYIKEHIDPDIKYWINVDRECYFSGKDGVIYHPFQDRILIEAKDDVRIFVMFQRLKMIGLNPFYKSCCKMIELILN